MNSTCTVGGICAFFGAIAEGLRGQPSVLRHDSTQYLIQRELIPTEIPQLQDNEGGGKEAYSSISMSKEEETSCSLYVATSSIPNAGFGIYAGKDFDLGDKIDPMPQIVIPLVSFVKKTILQNYPWSAYFYGSHLEHEETKILYAGLGMLANSHLGLINVIQRSVGGIEILEGNEDRVSDFGTGASSLYHASSFHASVGIQRGSELFLDYGEAYFHGREEQFVAIFPTHSNYEEANGIVRKFAEDLGEEPTLDDERAWRDIVTTIQNESDEDRIRVAYALPDSVEDVKYAAKIGTARYSIPESLRPIQWLEKNGLCLDNLRIGKSDIPNAGFGAFTMRPIKEGAVVAPIPVVPLKRDIAEKQLLLNYCFGHPKSSLLFFPYGSSTNVINHSDDPNSFIRWSSSSLSKSENLERNVDAVSTGLIMEVVALAGISAGEEVTINYGKSWSEAWNHHVKFWQLDEGVSKINPSYTANRMNEGENMSRPLKTIDEQEESPYPTCIRTACYVPSLHGIYIYTVPQPLHLKFCDVLNRYFQAGEYFYDVKVKGSDSNEILLGVPQQSIKFTPGEGCSNMHLQNAFRHEIEVAESMYSDLWLDLTKNEERPPETLGRLQL